MNRADWHAETATFEGQQKREVMARFKRAAYYGQCLGKQLGLMVAMMYDRKFLLLASDARHEVIERGCSKTLGAVLRDLRKSVGVPTPSGGRLRHVLSRHTSASGRIGSRGRPSARNRRLQGTGGRRGEGRGARGRGGSPPGPKLASSDLGKQYDSAARRDRPSTAHFTVEEVAAGIIAMANFREAPARSTGTPLCPATVSVWLKLPKVRRCIQDIPRSRRPKS